MKKWSIGAIVTILSHNPISWWQQQNLQEFRWGVVVPVSCKVSQLHLFNTWLRLVFWNKDVMFSEILLMHKKKKKKYMRDQHWDCEKLYIYIYIYIVMLAICLNVTHWSLNMSRLWSGCVWRKGRLTCHVAGVSVDFVLSDQFLMQLFPHSAQEVQCQLLCYSNYVQWKKKSLSESSAVGINL